MATLNLEITDIEGGHISVRLTSDIEDLDNHPITPAIAAVAAILDNLLCVQERALAEKANTKGRMH